ncbi:MAG: 4-hydroxy-tetrahydrodipicolinate synthase [Oscillospiraceae bacterium]|nr:4-hydroxy-tetrahydrodipicolinate synthase [Oscillospiraceae bacterium]
MLSKPLFKGSGVALISPFTENDSVDFETLEKLIEFQIENGTKAIIVCGTTGESAVLSEKERDEIINFSVNKINQRVPLIVGTGSNNTKHAGKLSERACELGADALLVVTPYYNKSSQDGIAAHYEYICKRVSVPVIVYNVPSRTGVNINPETYTRISKFENVVATKEANGDISSVIKTRALCDKSLDIYSGNDDQTLPIISVGGIGVISVFANVCPKESQQICELAGKEPEKAAELLLEFQGLMEALFVDVNPIPVKAALNLMKFRCGSCRLPLTSLSPKNLEKLKNELFKHNLI